MQGWRERLKTFNCKMLMTSLRRQIWIRRFVLVPTWRLNSYVSPQGSKRRLRGKSVRCFLPVTDDKFIQSEEKRGGGVT